MTTPRSPERFVPSPYLAECRRRAGAAHALAGTGVVVAVVLTRRWRAPWLVPAAGLAVAAVDMLNPWVLPWSLGLARGDAPAASGAGLQPAVDGMAEVLGLHPPQVLMMPAAMRAMGAAFLHPPRIYVNELCVPEPGVEAAPWLLRILAHEMGHHWTRIECSLLPYVARGPVVLAVLGVGTRSMRCWAKVAGVAALIVLPGLSAYRWSERAAEEVARQLGHAPTGRDDWPEWALVQHANRPWWRRLFGRRPQFLRSHPLPAAG
jgi:hypothetical protein